MLLLRCIEKHFSHRREHLIESIIHCLRLCSCHSSYIHSSNSQSIGKKAETLSGNGTENVFFSSRTNETFTAPDFVSEKNIHSGRRCVFQPEPQRRMCRDTEEEECR